MPDMPLPPADPRRRRRPPGPTAATALACALCLACGCGGGSSGPRSVARLGPAVIQPSAGTAADRSPSADLRAVRRLAERYYALLNGLRHQMSAGPLARLMTPDCPCRAQVRAIRRAARQGERYTDRVHVLRLEAHLDRADVADVVVAYDVFGAGLVDRRGHRLGVATTVHGVHRELMLRRIGERWLIDQVVAV